MKEALRSQPDRNAVRLKLLEIYANRKDTRAFDTVATELYGMTKGSGEDWLAAATMGMALDPSNPMYAAGTPPDEAGVSLAKMTAPTELRDEPDDLDALLASTQTNTSSSLDIGNTLAASSYFDNTTVAAAEPMHDVKHEHEPVLDIEELPSFNIEPEPKSADVKPVSDGLDFDLDGLSFDDVAPPKPATPMAKAEPLADLDAMDFDFLDKPSSPLTISPNSVDTITDVPFVVTDKPAPVPTVSEDLSFDDLPSMMETTIASDKSMTPEPTPMDFDLSNITLELDPSASHKEVPLVASPVGESHQAADILEHTDTMVEEPYSNSTEMSTKLDLALAYQEIGDKDGARELLDEVMKGGTPEQADRAKGLLARLG